MDVIKTFTLTVVDFDMNLVICEIITEKKKTIKNSFKYSIKTDSIPNGFNHMTNIIPNTMNLITRFLDFLNFATIILCINRKLNVITNMNW